MLILMFEPQNIDVVESLKKENKKLRKIIRILLVTFSLFHEKSAVKYATNMSWHIKSATHAIKAQKIFHKQS